MNDSKQASKLMCEGGIHLLHKVMLTVTGQIRASSALTLRILSDIVRFPQVIHFSFKRPKQELHYAA